MEKLSDYIHIDNPDVKLSEIEQAVKNYFDQNEQKKALDKTLKKARKEVEKYYSPGDLEDLEKIGITINYSQSEKSVLDEEMLLEKLEELELHNCIKTIKVPDEDAIAEGILNGEINPELLEECNKTVTSNRLYIKRMKK